MISEPVRVPLTALIRSKTSFTTPPRRFTVVQRTAPKRFVLQLCGGELYWTMARTGTEEFEAMSGSRSGEIFELSANATPAANNRQATPLNRLEPSKDSTLITSVWQARFQSFGGSRMLKTNL